MTSYPIRAVAKLTGISPDTLRAWERRYGAVTPARSQRGRQYGERDIERLRRLSRLVDRGHAIGGIAMLSDSELEELLVEPDAAVARHPRSEHEFIGSVLTSVDAFDVTGAQDALSRLASLQAPRDFVHQTVLPLMREVGARWHDGRLAVAQEHLVSQALRTLMGSLQRLYRPSLPTRRLVAATPPGERHEFGIMAASMLASMSGIDVVYLGADLPAEETARTAHRVNAGAILYGVTISNERTLDDVRVVADAMPATTALWLGGAAVHGLDVTPLAGRVATFSDLHAFEVMCQRWRH